ncbi:MAG: phosphotransacetylase family protein [Peptococcaceae bacterium]|nr:phosphotransacetylase family protein [Peptococcaceae bacterium]
MKDLYVIGYPGSGKTMVVLGLALKFKQEGKKVAYFKPVGAPLRASGQDDEDAVLMKEVLNMENPISDIVPCRAGQSYLSGGKKKESAEAIMRSYQKIAQEADLVIIDGAVKPYIYNSWGLDDVSLASRIGAVVLVTVKVEDDFSVDQTLFLNEYLLAKGVPLAGNLFNNIPWPMVSKTKGIFAPILEERGFKTLGVIPRRPEISSPTVEEFYKELGGEILVGHDRLNLLVEDIMVGAMTLEGAIRYLRRSADKAVVIGGDRADLALAALETSTSVLILTGGLYPDVKVLARAEEKSVPVILVHYDTYTTIEKISRVSRHITPGDKAGVRITLENIEEYCNWQAILEALEV